MEVVIMDKLKLSLLAQLDEKQKRTVIRVFDLLQSGNNVKKSDLRGIYDLTRLSVSEITGATKITRKQIGEICAKDPTIKNPDSTYSLTNLVKYLFLNRKKGDKDSGSASVLTYKERKEMAEARIREVQLQKLLNESIPVSEHEEIMTARFRGLIDFIKINFECRFKQLANKTEAETKVLGRQLMCGMLRAYCDQFTEKDLGESNEESGT
jgi:hypothetical protein